MTEASTRARAAASQNRDASVAFLQELIRLQPKGEDAVQARMAAEFEALGCEISRLRYQPADVTMKLEFANASAQAAEEREAITATLRGSGGGRSLIFFGHPDGEPIAGTETWTHDPFAATIENGRLYGWGIADDLAGIATMTEAVRAIRSAGLTTQGDVILTSTPSKRHARGVHAVMQAGHLADAAIYCHPAESGVGMREVKTFASGQVEFRVTVAGAPPPTTEPGHTAFAHLAVNPLDKALVVIAALKALDARRGDRIKHPSLEAAIGRSTNLFITYINCGNPNKFARTPASATLGAALSFPPGEALADVQAEVLATIAEAAAADPFLAANPPVVEWHAGVTGGEVPEDHPLYQVVSAAVTAVTGAAPHINPLHTSSDIRNPMVQQGIPCVGLGPLCGDLTQTGRHDEWVDVEDWLKNVEVAAATIADWCGTKG
ncbi:M20 family metallopeptidase [Humitalea sp. 24SJ18S-53]|uniref:M20 family metallopeptidase n=1 Tax=Humitalea sp. 24SJ18S-53 TaxID=3422307 RepID=UPI003D670D20